MNTTLESLGIGVAVFAVLLVLWRVTRKKSVVDKRFEGNAADGIAPIPATTVENFEPRADHFEAEVRMLIDYGNKIGAIRLVREKMGLDLNDAKDLVEKMGSGTPIVIDAVANNAAPTPISHDTESEARRLARNGLLIEAIKLVREKKGLDLKAAKAYVERL